MVIILGGGVADGRLALKIGGRWEVGLKNWWKVDTKKWWEVGDWPTNRWEMGG